MARYINRGIMERNQLISIARRKDIMDMRVKGYTYSEIVDEIKKKYNSEYSITKAKYDVKVMIRDMNESLKETAIDVLHLELNRLDNMQKAIYEAATGGDLKSMAMVLKIMAFRANLLGLNKPKEIKIHDWRSDIVELVKTGKITIEQVRQEIGDELTTELLESGSIGAIEGGEVEEGTFTEDTTVAGELLT